MEDIIATVRAYLVDNFVMGGDTRIAEETSFMEQHILDSTGFIELIGFIEERYGVQVQDEEMVPENFDSLRNVEGYVRRKLSEKAPA